jgi:hypothetical protein
MDEYINKLSPEMKEVLPYLLSGGAGALATSIAASGIKRKPKESRLAHLGKKLAIALGGGLAGAGIYKGIETAKDSFQNALPAEDVSTEENLVSATTNPNVIRGLAGGVAASGLTYKGMKDSEKVIKSMLPGGGYAGDSAASQFSDLVRGQTGDSNSKLTDWLKAHSRVTAPASPELDDIKSKITEEMARLNEAKKSKLPTGEIKKNIEALKNEFEVEKTKVNSALENTLNKRISRVGYKDVDFAGDTAAKQMFNTAKGKVRRGRLNVAGRTTAGRLGRAGLLATALGSPEIASYVGDLISSGENE